MDKSAYKNTAIEVGKAYRTLKDSARRKLEKGLMSPYEYFSTIDLGRVKLEKENGLLCSRVFIKKAKDVLYDDEYDKIKSNIKMLKMGCHWNARRISALIGAEVVYGEVIITKKGKNPTIMEHSWNRIDGEDFDLTVEATMPEINSYKRKGYSVVYYEIDSYKVSKLDADEHMEFEGGDVARAYGILDPSFHFTKGEYYAVA